MSWVIGLTLLAGFIWLGVKSMKMKKRVEQLSADFSSDRPGWEIFISDIMFDPTLIGVGAESRQITLGTIENHIDVCWSDICQVEVESNGTSLTTTNRGSQLLGGVVGNVLLGPMGLLLGGLTGSKSTRQRVNDLALKLVVEHPTRPTHRVIFFRKGGKGEKPNSRNLKAPAERLEHFHALILNAMRSAEHQRGNLREHLMPSVAAAPPELEQRIEKLWDLHQAGALTAQEYNERKQRLLAAHG